MPNLFRGWACVRLSWIVLLALAFVVPAGAQIFDFDNMVLLSRQDLYNGYNDVWGFVGTDGHEYIIQGTTTGTAWWDVDDPENPVHVKFIPGAPSIWRDMFVIGNYAYVGSEGGGAGIQVIDIADPTDPTLAHTYTATVSSSHNIFGDVSRELIFVVGAGSDSTPNGGLQILDVSNPLAPFLTGVWDNRYIHDISAEGTTAYASLIGENRFRPLDLTDPTNPVNKNVLFIDSSTHASWPLGDGNHIALTAEEFGGHLKIVDYTVPGSPVLADEDNPGPQSSAHNVHVEGDLCFVSWYARGTRVYDVSVPTNIVEVGFFDTWPQTDGGGVGPGNWGVYPHLPSGLIASNGDTGLFLLKYDPNAATLDGTISSSSGPLLENATVTKVSPFQSIVTDATGYYKFSSDAGNRTLITSAFGHASDTTAVLAVANGTTTTNIILTLLPSGGLDGTITDSGTTLPIEGVEVIVTGTPLATLSDANGDYAFSDIPTSPSPTYDVEFLYPGFAPTTVEVTLSTGMTTTEDVALAPAPEYVTFADPAGWSVVNDGATTGFWEFGEPQGTFSGGQPVQPDFDNTPDPEDQAAVTGNTNGGGIGEDDVDGGATRLLSPVYNLSGMSNPHVFYYRWYAVNAEADQWQVHVTTNGGGDWTLIENTPVNQAFWLGVDIDLTGITGSAPAVQFRFTAEDPDPGQIVEAALDDFALYDAGPGGVVGVHIPQRRPELQLSQNFPNPFPSVTRIDFSIPAEDHVVLSVFDVTGRRVATLVDAPLPAGVHSADWDGSTYTGGRAAAGVYFYKLKTKSAIQTKKMIRIQ